MATQTQVRSTPDQNILRPVANFPPTLWGYSFASFSFPQKEFEERTRRVGVLREEVKSMLMDSRRDAIESIELISLLFRLGVSYHFEKEIEEQLTLIFQELPTLLKIHDHDLSTTTLLFRVLRQHGFKVPCDVFEKFKDDRGKFRGTLVEDVKGILNLYEAAYVGQHGEDILDEALAFARAKLESLATQVGPHLAKQIKNVLTNPHHREVPRVDTRRCISFYQEDGSHNETLLEFAKVDFNRLQLLHQQELSLLSRWWKDLNLSKKLPYARDRIVEIYFWANGMHFEPEYAVSRMTITKYTMLVSLVDDTYDAYGTPDELMCFTKAMNRCSVDAIDQLPSDNMKVLYKALLDLYDETEKKWSEGGRFYGAYHVKEAFKELVREYHTEAQWSANRYVPSFNEYVRNGYTTSAYGVITAASFLGIKEAEIREYEWRQSNPKIIKAGKMIGRLMNDISGHEEEQKRGDCASGVECYMKEYGVSEKEAIEEIQKINTNAWKDVNEESMRPSVVPMVLIRHYVNLVRATDLFYKTDDAYTIPLSLKDHVVSLFVEKVAM